MLENNKVRLSGRLLEEFKVNHTCHELNYFRNTLVVERKSGVEDEIPLIIPETLLYHGGVEGRYATIEGEIRTYTTKKKHLAVVVFVKKVEYNKYEPYENKVEIKGGIYREAFLTTKKCKALKSDFMVKVNGFFEKSSNIPCVAFEDVALKTADLELNDEVAIVGRFQSRKYFKPNVQEEAYETYEVEVMELVK